MAKKCPAYTGKNSSYKDLCKPCQKRCRGIKDEFVQGFGMPFLGVFLFIW